MSILAPIILLMQTLPIPATPTSQPVADEIVVISEKLEEWKGGVYNDEGQLKCRIKQSTGDPEIDAIRCGAMLRCFAPHREGFATIAASELSAEDKREQMQELAESLQPCLDKAHEAGIRYLAEQRAGAK